jgi:choline-glycine betaine transporter
MPSPTRKITATVNVVSEADPTRVLMDATLSVRASMNPHQSVSRKWLVAEKQAPATLLLTLASYALTRSIRVRIQLT